MICWMLQSISCATDEKHTTKYEKDPLIYQNVFPRVQCCEHRTFFFDHSIPLVVSLAWVVATSVSMLILPAE